jgi:hypothetical protein
MTASREPMIVAAALAALVALAIVSTPSLGPVARRMPLVVACPTLVLLVAELVRLRRSGRARGEPAAAAGERRVFAWLGGLLMLVLALGMTVGVPVFLVASVRWLFNDRWRTALAMAVLMGVVLFVGLEQGLGIRLYPGLARQWLQEWAR